MRKWQCIVDGAIIWYITSLLFSYIDEFLKICWYCWGGGFFPYSLLLCWVMSENNLRLASGSGQYCSSALDMICYFTNKWLPSIPISSIYWKKSFKQETIQFFFCLQVTVGVMRVLWGWKLFWTREYKTQSVNFWHKSIPHNTMITNRNIAKFWRGGIYKPSSQTKIWERYQEVEFINHSIQTEILQNIKMWNS